MYTESETYITGDLISAGKLAIGDGYRAKNAELSDVGIPFARAGNIDGGFHFDGADKFPEEDLAKVGEKISRSGDVVFTSKGTVGRFAYVREDTPRFVFSPQLCYWRSLDTQLIDPLYLYYWMNGREFWEQACAVKGQTDMADYVSLTDQRRMKLTLPRIEVQRDIREVLSAFDDKIELNRQMNHTLEAMAQAIFKSWFVDFDPVTARAEGRQPYGMNAETAALFPSHFVESELGPIPEGWAVRDVYSVSKVIYGAPFSSTQFNSDGNGLPLLRIRDLATHEPSVYTDEEHPKGTKVEPGDLIVGMDGEFRAHIWHGPVSWLNQRVCKFVPLEKIGDPFVYFSILPALLEYERTKVGTTVIHLGKSDIDRMRIVVPEESIQKVFMLVAQPLFQRIVANGLESRTLQSIRDALLPKLLSGEIRVGQAEQIATEIA